MRQSLTKGQNFSIIIPLYNEEEIVPILIETVFREVGNHPDFLELVLVDDGSRDRTVEKIQEVSNNEPRIRLVRHGQNRGLGAGIRTGLQSAHGDLILYTDADLPFDFSLISEIVRLGGPDRIVSGYRLNRGEGPRRWIFTKVYNFLIYLLCGLRMRDVNFACKVIPRRFARQIQLKSEGSFIDAELLLEATRYGLSIQEFPMTYYPRTIGQSTLSSPKVILGIVKEMMIYQMQSLTAPVRMDQRIELMMRSPLIHYGLGFLFAIIALMLSLIFPASIYGLSPFFPLAVLAVSLYGGLKPGLLTASLSWLVMNVVMTPPMWGLSINMHEIPKAMTLLCCVMLANLPNTLRKRANNEKKAWAED